MSMTSIKQHGYGSDINIYKYTINIYDCRVKYVYNIQNVHVRVRKYVTDLH